MVRVEQEAGVLSPRVVVALVLAAEIALIWAWPYTPLDDWPNHMARHYLEALALAGQPLPAGYSLRPMLVPNLASDMVVPLLLQVMSPTAASAVFLSASLLLCWLGYSALVRSEAADRATGAAVALLALPWLMYRAFFWGNINFYISVGLAFLVIAHWRRLTAAGPPRARQLILHGLLIVAIYVCHFIGFVIYAVMHGATIVESLVPDWSSSQRADRIGRLVGRELLVWAPVVVPMAIDRWGNGAAATTGEVLWGTPFEKVRQAAAFFAAYHPVADVIAALLALAAVVATVRVDWLTLSFLAFLVLYLVLPEAIATTSDVDSRMPPAAFGCLLGLLARLPLRRPALGAALVLATAVVRIGSIGVGWSQAAADNAADVAFIHQIPRGSRILAYSMPPFKKAQPQVYIAAWAVPDRQALVSSLFADEGLQPLRLPVVPADYVSPDGKGIVADKVRGAFDYVWLYNADGAPFGVPTDWSIVHRLGPIVVWKVR
jgi:hypothetical protein